MQTVVYVKLLLLRIIRYGPLLGLPVAPRLTPGLTGLASEVTGRTDGSGFQCAHWISNWILRLVFVCRIQIIYDFDFFCLYSSFDESWPGVHICTGFDPNAWLMLSKLDPKSKRNPAS
jgi:hypothetical protein